MEFAPVQPPSLIVPLNTQFRPRHEWRFNDVDVVVTDTGSNGGMPLTINDALRLPVQGEGYVWFQEENHYAAAVQLEPTCFTDRNYTIETWVFPDNLVNDGPARVFQYGGNQNNLSLMIGQANRNSWQARASVEGGLATGADTTMSGGIPAVALQNITVVQAGDARSLFVDGTLVDADQRAEPLFLDDTFRVTVGDIVSDNRQFFGAVYYVAIHCQALDGEDVLARYDEVMP